MPLDASALEAYLTLLETADATIDRATARAFATALDTLATFAQSIEHRQSGHMAESTYRLGPFAVGDGSLEGSIATAAPYGVFEIAHGGTHDWPGRTLTEDARVLDALQAETGRIVATILGGGG